MKIHENYDLIVIGSGPAGEKGAAQAAYFGKKVAIIEKQQHPGGAAANTGTLPSKTRRETSLTLSGFRKRNLYGVDISLQREATVQDFMYHAQSVTDKERNRINNNIDRHKIDMYQGTASLFDKNTVKILNNEGKEIFLAGEVILIATGSRPRKPNMYPFEDGRIFDSDTILKMGKMPKSMIIVGGGVIGCEYGCTFATLGIEVSIVDGKEYLLPFLDQEISLALRNQMSKLGINFCMPDRVSSCETTADYVQLTFASGKKIQADAILICSGRESNVEELKLDNIGVKCGNGGLIEVNSNYQSSIPNIYAVGDVIGFPALASTSMEQARLAMVNAFDLKYKKEMANILPYGIYTIPEVSMAGETEESLKQKNINYVIGKAYYNQNARGQIIGDSDGFLKLIFELDTMKLLGVHVIGELATELVHIGLTALLTEATSDLFIHTCYNYPTLGELYKYATYSAMGNANKVHNSLNS